MCKITVYEYACRHQIQHVWSACRGRVKVTKATASDTPACQKLPSLYIRIANKCGSCTRTASEQRVREELAQDPSSNTPEILAQRLAEVTSAIPTTNWKAPQPPVYSRKPSQKRSHTRTTSYLRQEVKVEETCEPEPWKDTIDSADTWSIVPVSNGWEDESEWPSDTKSLADEIAEDREARGEVSENETESEAESNATETEGSDLGLFEQHIPTTPIRSKPSTSVSTPFQKSSSRPMRPSPKFFSESSEHYWYKQHKSNTSESTNESQVWELVVVQVN